MPLKYVGRDPGSDYAVMVKGAVDDRFAQVVASDEYIEDQAADAAEALVTPTYVDAQDALRANKGGVDAGDLQYLEADLRGAPNGVAPLGSDGAIPDDYLPTLYTTRWPMFKAMDEVFMTTTKLCTTTNAKEYEAARLTIPDPGFPYFPIPFASVRGGAANGTAASESVGTGQYGQITILDATNTKWGWTITSGHKYMAYHTALPFADSTINPTSRPPITGNCTLSLYLAVWTGANYTFDPTGMQFYALMAPAF